MHYFVLFQCNSEVVRSATNVIYGLFCVIYTSHWRSFSNCNLNSLCSFQEKIQILSPIAAEIDLHKQYETVQKQQQQQKKKNKGNTKIQLPLCVSIFLFYSPQNYICLISWLDASPILRLFKMLLTMLFIHYMNIKTVSK